MSLTTSMACHSINEIFGPLTREQTKRRIEYRHAIREKTLKCKVIFASHQSYDGFIFKQSSTQKSIKDKQSFRVIVSVTVRFKTYASIIQYIRAAICSGFPGRKNP